jgi:hypothetical protein
MSYDYSYDDEAVHLHDSDSSQNSATALDGYSGDVRVRDQWPGTEGNPKETRAKPEDMRRVATALRNIAADIQSSNAQQRVRVAANETSFGPPAWAEAGYLQKANLDAALVVERGTSAVARNLRAAADSIDAAAKGYADADSTTEAGLR